MPGTFGSRTRTVLRRYSGTSLRFAKVSRPCRVGRPTRSSNERDSITACLRRDHRYDGKVFYLKLSDEFRQALLENVRKERAFSFEEYKAMLNLQCGVDQSIIQSGGVAQAADKKYSSYIIELHGMELDGADGE